MYRTALVVLAGYALGACDCFTVATVEIPGVDTATPADTGSEPVVTELVELSATDLEDWRPLMTGNWPDELGGAYDCLHLPTGTYARWYQADGVWFEGLLGVVAFADWDEAGNGGLGEDGVYYGVDPVTACVPFYDLYVR